MFRASLASSPDADFALWLSVMMAQRVLAVGSRSIHGVGSARTHQEAAADGRLADALSRKPSRGRGWNAIAAGQESHPSNSNLFVSTKSFICVVKGRKWNDPVLVAQNPAVSMGAGG